MKTREGKLPALLAAMGQIERMERGRLCRMGSKPYHNLQHWEHGRNRVRYVPAGQVASVREAIDGYARFMEMAQRYADAVVERTRLQWLREAETGKATRPRTKGGAATAGRESEDV